MHKFLLFVMFAAIFAISYTGCSDSPVVPDTVQVPEPAVERANSDSNHQCLGQYFLLVDTSDFNVTVLQARTAALHVNVTGIMNMTMGVTAHPVPGESNPSIGLIVLDIGLKHPFPTKPQLTGFDVKGILMTPGSLTAGGLIFADIDDTRLLNADGYTRWWNPAEFTDPGMFGYIQGSLTKTPAATLTANVNPYKRFADILDIETDQSVLVTEPFDSDLGRGVFKAGETNSRRYRIQFKMNPGPQLAFGYAVDASWAPPVPNPPTEIPDNFPIAANQPEPFAAEVEITENTLYFNTAENNGGGDLTLLVHVNDWQGQSTGSMSPEISAVNLYVPGLLTGPVSGSLYDLSSTEAVYQFDLMGDIAPASLAPIPMVAEIISADSATYKQTTQSAPDVPLQLFQVFAATVAAYNCPADDNESYTEAEPIALDGTVNGTLCKPDDAMDYYSFSIPAGVDVSGTITLLSASETAGVLLFDSTPDILATEYVSGGQAVIDVSLLGLVEGDYYLVAKSDDYGNIAYSVEMDLTLTPQTVNLVEGEYTPDFLYCNPGYVLASGDYAIMMSNSGLWIFDISNVQHPVPVSHLPIIPARTNNGVALDGTKLYFLTGYNLVYCVNYVDLSDFSSPVIHYDVVTLGQNTQSIEAENDILYVGYQDGIDVYTTSPSPESPAFLTSFTVTGFPMDMEMLLPGQANTHLVVSIDESIYSYNVDDPHNISADGNYTFPYDVHDFSINYDHIYAAINGSSSACNVYSIKQTAGALLEDDNLDLSSYITGINCIRAADNQYVVAVSWDWTNPDVVFINRSDPTDIIYAGKAPIENTTNDIMDVSSGDYCIFTHFQNGWSIYDTSTPILDFQYKYDAINYPIDSSIIPAEDLLLVLNQPKNDIQQLYSIDLSVPGDIVIADMLQFDNNWIYSIAHNGCIAATSDDPYNIMLVDFSDPYDLTVINNITPSYELQSQPMYIYNNTLYAVLWTGDYELQAWDITNPSSPVEGGSTLAEGAFLYYATDGNYLYAYNADDIELLIYDITTPAAPIFTGSIEISADEIYDMCIVNHTLYMAHGTGLLTFSLADHENPSQIDEDIVFPSAYETCLDANSASAFMHIDDEFMPVFLSLSNPSNPENVQTFNYQYDYSLGISASDDWLCFMSGYYGPRIYQLY